MALAARRRILPGGWDPSFSLGEVSLILSAGPFFSRGHAVASE